MARNPLTAFRSGNSITNNPLFSLHREMDRLFDDVLRGGSLGLGGSDSLSASMIAPQMNVSETDDGILVTAELPGVTENDINVDLHDNMLTIRGEKKFEHKDDGKKENFHFIERSYGTFQRSLQLPFAVNPEQVKADFENGVLTVSIPKDAQLERSRRIQVQGHGTNHNGEGSKSSSKEEQNSKSGKK